MFEMDKRLVGDTVELGDFALSRVLLMNDSRYPWLILVPRVVDASEVFDLQLEQQQELWQETQIVAHALKHAFAADKINIATLGNVVSQLHMHIVVRMQDDDAWPAPVWGRGTAQPYSKSALIDIRTRLQAALAAHLMTDKKVEL